MHFSYDHNRLLEDFINVNYNSVCEEVSTYVLLCKNEINNFITATKSLPMVQVVGEIRTLLLLARSIKHAIKPQIIHSLTDQ